MFDVLQVGHDTRHHKCLETLEEGIALSKCVFSLAFDPHFARVGRTQSWSRVAVHLPVCFQFLEER